jgi:peptide chain release factor subunit 1
MELLPINQEELRLLERMGREGRWVLSVFLRLDRPEVPTRQTRGVELNSLLTEAAQRLRSGAEAAQLAALESCLERVGGHLRDAVVGAPTVHGVAYFCEEGGELRAYALRRRPDFDVAAAFRHGPALEPLIEAMPGPVWGVTLVSKEHGRVFRGTDTGLVEVGEVDDDVHRRHSQGGWSQGRYQRGIEKESKDHVGRVCDLLFALHEHQPFDHLAILGPPQILPVVESGLHPYLRERLAGQVAVDIEHASAEQVLEQVGDLMAEQRLQREREAIERLEEGLGTGDQAVAGLAEVLAAVEGRRVETLLVGHGPLDEQVERAVDGAVAQAAEVLVLEAAALEQYGQIAALLRY